MKQLLLFVAMRGPLGLLGLLGPLGLLGCSPPGPPLIGHGARPSSTDDSLVDIDGNIHRPLTATGSTQVLVFITHDCPIANQYARDLLELAKQLGELQARLLLVHVDPDLNATTASTHATEYGYAGKVPVVLDCGHRWVSALRPEVTPEAFVLTEGRVRYRGRINGRFPELGKRRATAGTHDLRNAIQAVQAGRGPVPARTRAVGCRIPEHAPSGQ